MKTIEYHNIINKSAWPRGPWDNEPDKKQWQSPSTGLPCMFVRNRWGALCGYVGVPSNHPAYGKSYGAVDSDISVHGGLTFSEKCLEGEPGKTICHIVEPGESDDTWWFGFDCAHCDDLAPNLYPSLYTTYRDQAYVEAEVEHLANQLFLLSNP